MNTETRLEIWTNVARRIRGVAEHGMDWDLEAIVLQETRRAGQGPAAPGLMAELDDRIASAANACGERCPRARDLALPGANRLAVYMAVQAAEMAARLDDHTGDTGDTGPHDAAATAAA